MPKEELNAVGPLLTAWHHGARLAFAIEHQNWQVHQWSPVLYTDESRFTLNHVADMKGFGEAMENVMLPDVTLDPDTASPYLILSADGKQVTHGDTRQDLPDTPERINTSIAVLGKQSFSSGRFYYEVQVREKTAWTVGVAKESINRKGKISLTPQSGFWTVALRNENQYKACADPPVLLTLREKVEVVGVFVDYEEGLVSFYDVKSRSHIYSFTGQCFTVKLYPFFSPGLNDGGKNSAPLIISPVFKTE
ncbi:E3 ubiquitin-protein ligase TRIM69-like [Hemibagrus wyckioides]|uniref:E3 ubiquitin-protein ligase TRIM69-like n=1 Tax=Hemibagrus wyckioides TaxID=337641 RepID=UPI00266C4145|nr:E3 ubiquitin-protein ligase TRIM69-like [Hemibagrus wyckioides]